MLLSVMLPIFILILMGYASVGMGLIQLEQTKALGTFVMKVSLPAFMLYTLSQDNQLDDLWIPSYLMVYGVASLALFFAAYYCFKRWFLQRPASALVLSLGAATSNTGLVGAAILPMLIGKDVMYYLALTILFESFILTSLMLFLAESSTSTTAQFSVLSKKTLQHIFRNPLVLAILIGLTCLLFEYQPPSLLMEPLAWLGKVSAPLALFVIGGTLSKLRLRHIEKQAILLMVLKTLCLPALVFALFLMIPKVDDAMVHIAVMIAMLPMPTLFMTLGQIYGIEKRTNNAFILSNISSLCLLSMCIHFWY
ncbi:AEC family transporter [Acinetobacter rathckeae]|uniref:AEC family transporter n=1 Tax=Acinetobacter rathckeae TaxID=2605272 RepID=UPI0018A268F1|nr:AEC family transporter [Acinetobacter rathckeae]MBF7686758.1 AEC family transporter [Acinetobacter rathckeae]MBF7695710.1 AEC family transporter [Acinetobacter rathckeae]